MIGMQPIDPRAFGVVADGVADDTEALMRALAAGPVDGGGATCAVTEVVVSSGQSIRNITLKGTSASCTPLKVGEVGAGGLYNNTDISIERVTVTGVGKYGFVFSNMTDFTLSHLKVTGFAASEDVFHFHRMYAGSVSGLIVFGGTTAGASGSAICLAHGVNGLSFLDVYTSAFIRNGVSIRGGCASNTFISPVVQGHSEAWNIEDVYGLTLISPYTENCVNPFVIGAGVHNPRGISVLSGGYISGHSEGNPFAANDNGVMVMLNRGTSVSFENMVFAGVTNSASGKQIASVNNGSVLNLIDPITQSGDVTEPVTNFLRKEPGALSTSGYYVADTGAALPSGNTERVTVERSIEFGNRHVIRYRTGPSTVSETEWVPTDNV